MLSDGTGNKARRPKGSSACACCCHAAIANNLTTALKAQSYAAAMKLMIPREYGSRKRFPTKSDLPSPKLEDTDIAEATSNAAMKLV